MGSGAGRLAQGAVWGNKFSLSPHWKEDSERRRSEGEARGAARTAARNFDNRGRKKDINDIKEKLQKVKDKDWYHMLTDVEKFSVNSLSPLLQSSAPIAIHVPGSTEEASKLQTSPKRGEWVYEQRYFGALLVSTSPLCYLH